MHGNWHASMLPATRSNFSHDINIMKENSIFSITFSFSHYFIPCSSSFSNILNRIDASPAHSNCKVAQIYELMHIFTSDKPIISKLNDSYPQNFGRIPSRENIALFISEWIYSLSFILFFIIYPGVSNPGPAPRDSSKNLSVFYQNLQGLIPFSSLPDPHPNLDRTKIFELQAYISKNIPDIVILNETWLKPTILNSELFSEAYDIFRLDRSPKSHPPDPLDPKKFRRNGGGVLIAINNNLSLRTKMIPVKCTAELLAVELTLPDCTKIIITTCYRVGTLGVANCNQIMQALNKLRRKKMLRKFLVIGDLNLKSINWSTGTSENALETEFLNGFAELGLDQCIDAATHNKGNILDVLLTKSKHYISDIKIIDTERFCISYHYAIRFNIKHKVYRKPRTKRTCYNYKNARWENLNNDLNTINWDSLLDFQEPEAAWKNFKNILFRKIDINVPKFTIKSEYQPPWFDSECYLKCKEKDKLHV